MFEDVKGRKKDPSLFGGTYMKNAMQLKAYVKNLAKKKNISAQIVLQNYMIERLLERISVSKYFVIFTRGLETSDDYKIPPRIYLPRRLIAVFKL